MTGRQESDVRIVPEGRRKASRAGSGRQGKAGTVDKQAEQLVLYAEPAALEPLSTEGTSPTLPPMTMEEIANEANLKAAFKRVAANRGAPGPDRQNIQSVRAHLDDCLSTLHQSLLDGSYHVGDVRRVWLPKANGGRRGLGIPNVVDRIVQQAVHQVLSPHYERTFHERSHGFRPGRSCHTAIKQAKEDLEAGYGWVVDLDLEKFFDRVNHDRLISRLEQRISDRRVLSLIRQMLRAGVILPGGAKVMSDTGMPQGGPLSPLLSNVVLDELDWELDQRGHRFVRYADDCNVYVRTERAGIRVMASLTSFLRKRLKLTVNADKSRVTRPENTTFLSFKLHRVRKSGEVTIHVGDGALKRLVAELKAMTPRNWGRSFMECIRRLNVFLRGWLGYFGLCDKKQRAKFVRFDAHLRRRLRAILLKQWKTKRQIVKRLIRMGVPPAMAQVDIYVGRRSWWKMSSVRAVCWGLRNEFFERCGLINIYQHWQVAHQRIWGIGPPTAG